MKTSIMRAVVFTTLMTCLFALGVGWAQESTIQGTVTDITGGVIPGAEVKAKNLDTGISRSAITNDEGFYKMPLLKEGIFEMSCSNAGFATATAKIRLGMQQVIQQDFKLRVGQMSEVVEVTASGARLQFKPQDVGSVIEEKQIHELPLDGRNYLSLAQLTPGILRGAVGGRGEQTSEEGGFRSGGLAMDQTAILVDGVDNASRTVQGPLATQAQTLKPAIEAVSEFKVVTNNVSAEYGYKAGAQVMVATKGGSNQFHGALYEFHRNSAVSANNFMFNRDSPRDPVTNELTEKSPKYIRNQFGGTIGGPIIKDQTFFFFSVQGTRLRNAGNSFLQSVPSQPSKTGDFSQELNIGNGSGLIYDPLTLTGTGAAAVRKQFPGNRIPESRMDPVARQLMALFPDSNLPGRDLLTNNFFWVQRNRNDGENYDARIDHNFSDNHRMFGRYSYRTNDVVTGGVMPYPARASNNALYTGHQIAINYNATLSHRSHNEMRGGFTHFPAARQDEHTENLNQKFGVKGAAIDQFPDLIPEFFNRGLVFMFFGNRLSALGGGSGGGTNQTKLSTFYVADNFMVDVGKHSLKFGGEYRRWRSNRLQGNVFGTFNFDGRYTAERPNVGASRNNTGHTFADALLGWLMNSNNGLPIGEDIASPYYGFYFQDDWRVTPRFTINFGLRWEIFMQPSHVRFDPTTPIARAIFSGNLHDEKLDTLDVRFDHWAFPKGDGDCGCIRDKKNFAPRLAFAYRLSDKTVLRLGGGFYYSENGTAQLETNRFQIGGPNSVALLTPQTFETTEIFASTGLPPLSLEGGDPGILPGPGAIVVGDFMPTISSGQWFLDIQHEFPGNVLLTLGYNGQAQSHIHWWGRNVAAPLEPGNLAWNHASRLRTPLPAAMNSDVRVNSIALRENILNANYNAFTTKVEKRFGNGMSFLNAFTWSKTLDYGNSSINERSEGLNAIGGAGAPPSQYLKDIWMNYGLAGLHRKLSYNASLLYELPAGPGKARFQSGPASWILGGWQLGAIVSFQTGPWLSHRMNVDNANTYGAYRGDLVGDVNLPETERDSMRWFNDTAIVAGEEGRWGNAGRGLIEAPGWKNFDFLLSKNFPMPLEGHRLQFRFEAFNFTNTPHLGAPTPGGLNGIIIGNSSTTRIIAADEPRILQFALKYLF